MTRAMSFLVILIAMLPVSLRCLVTRQIAGFGFRIELALFRPLPFVSFVAPLPIGLVWIVKPIFVFGMWAYWAYMLRVIEGCPESHAPFTFYLPVTREPRRGFSVAVITGWFVSHFRSLCLPR